MDGWKNSGIYERGLKRFQIFSACVPTLFTAESVCQGLFFKVLGSDMIIP